MDNERTLLSFALSNKEGGAHIDPHLDPAWAALTRYDSMAVSWGVKERQGNFTGLELASMRQIAHKLLASLERSCPDLCR